MDKEKWMSAQVPEHSTMHPRDFRLAVISIVVLCGMGLLAWIALITTVRIIFG